LYFGRSPRSGGVDILGGASLGEGGGYLFLVDLQNVRSQPDNPDKPDAAGHPPPPAHRADCPVEGRPEQHQPRQLGVCVCVRVSVCVC